MREAAVRALGEIGDTTAIEQIIAATEDEDENVHEAATEVASEMFFNLMVDELLQISAEYPSGIWKTPAESRVIEIGTTLNEAGGMPLMRAVHREYTERLPQVSREAYENGWSRNLDRWWDGIANDEDNTIVYYTQ